MVVRRANLARANADGGRDIDSAAVVCVNKERSIHNANNPWDIVHDFGHSHTAAAVTFIDCYTLIDPHGALWRSREAREDGVCLEEDDRWSDI